MPLTARRHIRKMRGGAQSHLLEADNGACYVVKFRNNPQHRRILVNELIGSEVFRYLQISTPETAIVSLTPEFLRDNPEVHLQLGSGKQPVEPGWHFGSRYPGDPDRLAVYDFLPDSLLPSVSNRSHFLGALVADKWMSNADGRQSIFFRARLAEWSAASGSQPRRAGFIAQMIDQGYLFNGPQWEFTDSPLQGLAPRSVIYQGVRSLDDFQPWLDQVTWFPEEVLDTVWKRVPPQWTEGEDSLLEQLLEKLLRRRPRVAELLAGCRRAKPSLFPDWK